MMTRESGPGMPVEESQRGLLPNRRRSRLASLKVSLQCRICRWIGAAVLLSIFAIEAAILIPSSKNYERDLLLWLQSSGRAEIMVTYRSAGHSRDRDLLIMGRALIRRCSPLLQSVSADRGRASQLVVNPLQLRLNLNFDETGRRA